MSRNRRNASEAPKTLVWRKCVAGLVTLLLSGCGAADVHSARDPWDALIGMTLADLLSCMGPADKPVQQIADDQAILTWVEKTSDAGIKLTFLGTGFEAAGGGECKAVVRVLRDGRDGATVADVAFPGVHNVSLFSAPYSACAPLVDECVRHPSETGGGAGAWRYLLPQAGKAP